jgi:endonuclease/exonuclease/phosphatase family metal-dependent hydrolase
MSKRISITHSIILVCLCMPLAGNAQAGPGKGPAEVAKIEVMTQNLYVGADVFRLFEPATCGPTQSVFELFETVKATNFPERAEAIADIVQRNRPHVIGLQEVSLIRSQTPADGEIAPNPDGTFTYVPNAETVEFDYLELLVNALGARGLDYVVVEGAISNDADVELPMASYDDECTLTSIPTDLRLTDRDVILVRGDLVTANAMSANFLFNLPVRVDVELLPGQLITLAFEFTRGFGAVDVTVGKVTHRVVNTHLEVGDDESEPESDLNSLQFAQAFELASKVTGTGLPLTVIGDFNSSPNPLDPRPGYAVMAAFGYLDLWNVRQGSFDPGFSCCQDELLRNESSALDERIDHVFTRLPEGSELLPIQWDVVGVRDNEKTVSGMWPSDHAGVATTLKFRR